MSSGNKIYLDYAASTPVDQAVLQSMMPYLTEFYGNAGGVHHYSKVLSEELENQRGYIAKSLGANTSEVIFTSSATESNNTIIKGVAYALQKKGRHILISSIDHPSVYKPAEYLHRQGYIIERIPVHYNGLINIIELENMIREDTILVSVMHVNNETGVIQPIADIGNICRKNGILFHTDAAQSLGKMEINLTKVDIDYLSASSHKTYGPLGAALLYCRSGSPFIPLLHGGGQEDDHRSSTVNIPAISGFGHAFKLAIQKRSEEWDRLKKIRENFNNTLINSIPDVQINGDESNTIPGIISVSFKDTDAEILSMQLNRKGIAVSTGSACSSGSITDSTVLKAMGLGTEWIRGTIRFSMGRQTTEEEIETLFKILPDLVQRVRKIR